MTVARAAPPQGAHERTGAFLAGVARVRLPITTPEGVRLAVDVATYGERASAFLIDMAIIVGAVFVLILGAGVVAGVGFHTRLLHGNARLVFALVGLAAFLLRTLYFVRFELAWQGATPGKRLIGLRVIDRQGGPLLPGPVITRNVTREIEVFLPLAALMSASARGWNGVGLVLWTLLLACVPLFTQTRLRAGDMLAGTLVIAVPRRALLPDIMVDGTDFVFSERQLRAYGAFELQVLEEILRRPPGEATAALQADVCGRICKRIGWDGGIEAADLDRFLRQFYAAERGDLERAQLLGKGREEKEGLLF